MRKGIIKRKRGELTAFWALSGVVPVISAVVAMKLSRALMP